MTTTQTRLFIAVAIVIATVVAVVHFTPIVKGLHRDSLADVAYKTSGLILPSGMDEYAVANRVCETIIYNNGVDGAVLQLSASGGFDPGQSRAFVQTLRDNGYCPAR